MKKPTDYMEIFLQPGEFYFGDFSTRIRTLLGSCVALTMWHPEQRIGGMCHCMLPGRERQTDEDLDGKYIDEAIELFQQEFGRSQTSPKDYEVKLFGGANMFPGIMKGVSTEVGIRNIARCLEWVEDLRLKLVACHVGDIGHRNVVFDVWSGDVWMKHQKSSAKTVKP